MPLSNRRRGNQLGVVGLILTVAFWAYAESSIHPNAFTQSAYVLYALLPGVLIAAAVLSIAAAASASKLWLLALLGPGLRFSTSFDVEAVRKGIAVQKCLLTTPSFLSRGTRNQSPIQK